MPHVWGLVPLGHVNSPPIPKYWKYVGYTTDRCITHNWESYPVSSFLCPHLRLLPDVIVGRRHSHTLWVINASCSVRWHHWLIVYSDSEISSTPCLPLRVIAGQLDPVCEFLAIINAIYKGVDTGVGGKLLGLRGFRGLQPPQSLGLMGHFKIKSINARHWHIHYWVLRLVRYPRVGLHSAR